MAIIIVDAIVVVVIGSRCVVGVIQSVDELAVTDMTLLLFIVDGDGSCDR